MIKKYTKRYKNNEKSIIGRPTSKLTVIAQKRKEYKL